MVSSGCGGGLDESLVGWVGTAWGLLLHCRRTLGMLSRDAGMLGVVFRRAKSESLDESENLPEPDVLALEIAKDLQAALGQFSQIVNGLT